MFSQRVKCAHRTTVPLCVLQGKPHMAKPTVEVRSFSVLVNDQTTTEARILEVLENAGISVISVNRHSDVSIRADVLLPPPKVASDDTDPKAS